MDGWRQLGTPQIPRELCRCWTCLRAHAQWNHWGASRRPWGVRLWEIRWSYGSVTGGCCWILQRCNEGPLAITKHGTSHWCIYYSFPELIPPCSQNFCWQKWLANESQLVCPVGLRPGNWRLLRLGKLCSHIFIFSGHDTAAYLFPKTLLVKDTEIVSLWLMTFCVF